jgi:LacI family transcriptional regulator
MGSKTAHRAVLLVTDWFEPRFNQGVARFARERGWYLSLEAAYSRELPHGWRGDGCIAMIGGAATAKFVKSLGVPTVSTSQSWPSARLPIVDDDNLAVGRMAARHFLERGYRHLAYCTPGMNQVAIDRLAGFAGEAAKTRVHVAELLAALTPENAKNWTALRSRLRVALKALPKPCGVFCVDDRLAAMVCDVATEVGVSVPGELSVLGVGNLEIACECSPVTLSSIALDPEAHGYAAAGMLEELFLKKPGDHAPAELPTRLLPPVGVVERASTRGVAVHDPALSRAVARLLENPEEEISADALARHAGIGRQKLYDLFAAEFRCTPGAFVEQARLRLACRLLADPERKLDTVAKESGFGSALRMHRAFLRRFSLSPGRWRKLAAAGKAPGPDVLPAPR